MAVPAVTAFFFWNRELLSEGDLNCCQVSITIRDSETSGDHLRESVFFGHSPVAQLVEQAAVNRLVVGSSPTGGARFFSAERNHRPVNARRREIGRRAFRVLGQFWQGFGTTPLAA